jgi:hypothetical protein
VCSGQAKAVSAAVRAAALHQACCQVPTVRIARTAAPDSAIPAPTPPIAQPTACGGRSVSIVVDAETKIIALATPATSRSADHPEAFVATGINASVPIRTRSDSRRVARERTSPGTAIAATAPTR